jgi:hypothetical protein
VNDLPEPLLPADVDLRDFAFMPLHVRRLRDSRLVATRKAEEALAAILLWSASWHQVPSASIPDDDFELAQLAGYGRAAREFKRIRDGALHGFVKCSDGRFYHPVVAEQAAEAWNRKLDMEWRRACDRIRKENKDLKEKGQAEQSMPAKPEHLERQDFFQIPRWVYPHSVGIPPDGSSNPSLIGKERIGHEGTGQDKPDSSLRSESSSRGAVAAPPAGRTVATWDAYATAYQQTYGVTPLRNAQINGQIARFLSLVGTDAPAVAAFYLSIKERYYVQHRHPVGAMLKDASSLWTQWKTGQRSTETAARMADRTADRGEQANRFLSKSKP